MLDGPVICWNISFLFPYSQLFLQSRPSRFHNSVEIIIVSQGSERVLQIMGKILSPLPGDASSSCWSLQSCSVLVDWSYLSMGSKIKSQYQLIGDKIHQKSLDHHPEEENHYFSLLLASFPHNPVGFPAPHQTQAVDPGHLWCQSSGRHSSALFTPWSNFLNFGGSFGNMAKGCLPFLRSREGEHLNRKIWSNLACSKDCRSWFVMLLSVQRGHCPCLRQELFAPWYPFCAAIGEEHRDPAPLPMDHVTFFASWNIIFLPSLLETLRNTKLGKTIPK